MVVRFSFMALPSADYLGGALWQEEQELQWLFMNGEVAAEAEKVLRTALERATTEKPIMTSVFSAEGEPFDPASHDHIWRILRELEGSPLPMYQRLHIDRIITGVALVYDRPQEQAIY